MREALKKAVGEKPDLILLDIVMPDMSGYEVLERMGKLDGLPQIRCRRYHSHRRR